MNYKMGSVFIAAFFLSLNGFLSAQTVIRGPYLQSGTPTSVIVRWRTDQATASQVKYGVNLGNLNLQAGQNGSTTEHEVRLSNLSPDTKYYYAIGADSQTLAGGDERHFFITSPLAGEAKPTRLWILGDSGTKNDNARAVRDAYYNFTGSRHTDLWLMLGDNAYSSGTDAQYQQAVFENMYEDMLIKSVLWPTLGNHDVNSSSSPGPNPFHDIFTLPTNGEAGGLASGSESYYAFDYGNIHFICLNSNKKSEISTGSTMLTWLEEDLAANDKDWTIAFWHHPPYSKGTHDSDSDKPLVLMRQFAVPILEDGGVDLILSGHSHNYERSYLIDGHYGDSGSFDNSMLVDGGDGRIDGDGAYKKRTLGVAPHEGAVYVVAGSSGQAGKGSFDHPVMLYAQKILGSLVLDIENNRLEATFIDDQGSVVDYFTMIKGNFEVGPPAQLVMVSGDNQSALVGTALSSPLVVAVKDASNNPVSGVAVSFVVASGDATLQESQPVRTAANGRAQATLLLGATPGRIQVTATAAGLSDSLVTFTATGLEGQQDTTPPAPPLNVRVQVGGE
ncbi:MAG: metallophosphoesterase [bacterium]